MNKENRIAMLPELEYITNPKVYQFALECIAKLPEYIFHIPASSSGKYHPNYTIGDGGLIRHIRAAMNIYRMLTENDSNYWYQWDCNMGLTGTDFDDAAYLALLFHDSFKSGKAAVDSELPPNEHTIHEHPLIAASFLKEQLQNMEDATSDLSAIVYAASDAICSHMGKWTYSKYSSVILPSPANGDWLAKLVHTCDYIASRKELEYQFSGGDAHAQ